MDDLRLDEIVEYGQNAGRGNLLGVEPYMSAADYASQETFQARLDGYLTIAAQRGWLSERTVVVWPEYIAAWLVAAAEKDAVYRAPTLKAAMQMLVLSHPLQFVRHALAAAERDRIVASLFRMKAAAMAAIYQATFSGLALKYRATVVAGSIVLPSPRVRDGKVTTTDGPLYNVAAVYRPDGLAHATLVRKAFPIGIELPFTAAAAVAELPAFDTPAGRLGVLICADSWYPAAYDRLREHGVALIAVPSDGMTPEQWAGPWRGYDGAAAPPDVEPADVGRLTEAQAWRKYALAGRIALAGARHGINVFLRGELWDLAAHGGCATVVDRDAISEGRGSGAALVDLWL